ncbi:MAG: hypothetical protein ABIO44_01755, partial [Saprospiraceae bacterium]
GAGNYIPAKSTITPFTFTIPTTWCDKTYEIVGIVNPKPDPMCCKEIFTERFTVSVKCPIANKAMLEVCDDGTGKGKFLFEDAEATILGSIGGIVEWFRDAVGTMRILSPYISSTTVVYARVKDGNCASPLIPIDLRVTLFTAARSTSEERCGDIDGFATFVLINLENFIRNGNNGVNVKFYEDINKTTPIIPPLRTGSIIIYAATCNGDCESVAVPIKLIVNPLPIAKYIQKIECPEPDGKASFDLTILEPLIKDSIKNNIVTFFSDSTLKDTVFSPFRTDSSSLFAIVSNGKCKNVAKVMLKVGKLQFNQKILKQQCEDFNGNGSFDLNEVAKKIQGGDISILVSFYSDSNLLNSISSPYVINQSTKIFVQFQKGSCKSNVFSIQLELVVKPFAKSFTITRCSNPDENYDINTDSLSLLVNSDPSITVEFYSEINLINKINGIFSSKTDTLYALSKLGDCASNPVEIYLIVTPTPTFNPHVDTSACSLYVLDSIKGINLGTNTFYTYDKQDTFPSGIPGNTITKTGYLYRYSSNMGCNSVDSFYIKIQQPSNAGVDQQKSVCDGSLVDLSKLITNADPGGTFSEAITSPNLNGKFFNTTGLNGKSRIVYYIVPAIFPCLSDSSEIKISVVKQLSAGLDTLINLCSIDSVNLYNLLRNADPGGIFTDQSGKIISSKINGKDFGFGQYNFYYNIGDGISCPKTFSTLTIRF